jgi:hypothetical protein
MTDTANFTKETIQRLKPLAERIVKARLDVPAVFFLELQKPVSELLHAGLMLSEPVTVPLFGIERIRHLEALFSNRTNIEYLIQMIESSANTEEG